MQGYKKAKFNFIKVLTALYGFTQLGPECTMKIFRVRIFQIVLCMRKYVFYAFKFQYFETMPSMQEGCNNFKLHLYAIQFFSIYSVIWKPYQNVANFNKERLRHLFLEVSISPAFKRKRRKQKGKKNLNVFQNVRRLTMAVHILLPSFYSNIVYRLEAGNINKQYLNIKTTNIRQHHKQEWKDF